CPPLPPEEAAGLAAAFLLDTVSLLLRVHGASVTVAVAPPSGLDRVRRLLPAPLPGLTAQPRGDLGRRLEHLFAAAPPGRPIVAVGADTPDLPSARVAEAFDLLETENDIVIGPARDGGYYLIAARRPQPLLFRG